MKIQKLQIRKPVKNVEKSTTSVEQGQDNQNGNKEQEQRAPEQGQDIHEVEHGAEDEVHGDVHEDVNEERAQKRDEETTTAKIKKHVPLKVPRKHMPFANEAEDVWEKTGKDPVAFQEKLRGPLGYQAVFMPTPGLVPFYPLRGTPPASTPPNQVQGTKVTKAASTQQSTTSGAAKKSCKATKQSKSTEVTRRSTRLVLQTAFKFKNTEDNPVELGD